MKTQSIVEGLLYVNKELELPLTISHVIDKKYRNWKAAEHTEFYFLEKFKKVKTLIIIDKLVHIYLIGEKDKGRTYHVLNIEGNITDHLIISKGGLFSEIKNCVKYTMKQFLPIGLFQRVIFLDEDNIFIFNRMDMDDKILKKKSNWTLGTEMYLATTEEYKTDLMEIVKQCLNELD